MHAVSNVLTQFLSVLLAYPMKLLGCSQRLLMVNIRRQCKGFQRVGLFVKLLLLIQLGLMIMG